MNRFITFLMVTLLIMGLISTATAADKKITKEAEFVQSDVREQGNDSYFTVYQSAKKKAAPMHGDYTIGITGVYVTFADAITDLKANGLDGDVRLLVQADYDVTIVGEALPITFKGINTSGFYIIVTPKHGETAVIAGSHATAVVRVDSQANMIFDGFNGTSNYNLTIMNTGNAGASSRSLYLCGASQFNQFKNMNFRSGARATNYSNVHISGFSTGGVQDCSFDNDKFFGNGEDNAEIMVSISGNATGINMRDTIRNSFIYDFKGLSPYMGSGISNTSHTDGLLIENNDITISYPSTDYVAGAAGIIIGSSTGNVKNVIVRNNNIHDLVSTTASTACYGIQLSGVSTQTSRIATEGITVDNNTITNIKAPHLTGVSVYGITVGNSVKNSFITNNHISDLGGGGIQPTGIRVNQGTTSLYPMVNIDVIGNTIDGLNNSTLDPTYVYTYAISTGYVDNCRVMKNKITNITTSGPGKYVFGILHSGAAGMTISNLFANNFVSIPAASAERVDQLVIGIGDWAATGGNANTAEFYYNSVYLGGTSFDATEFSSAFYHGAFVASPCTAKDNIFYNNRTGGDGVAIEADKTTLISDYNDLYASSGTTGYYGVTVATTLADWTTASGQDANSKSVVPTYKTNLDLHMKVGTATTLDNAGTPVSVLDDIDGDARGLGKVAPDIGADEFEAGAPGAFVLVSPTSGATNVPVNGNLTWNASPNTYSYDVYLDTLSSPGLVGNVTGTSYSYSGLSGSTKYFWKIGAKNDIGTVFATNSPDSFTTAALPPTAPSGITFTAVTAASLTVHWVDNSSNETGFNIYKAIGTDAYTLEGTVGAGVQLFPVASLSPNVRYHFRVTAYQTVQGESNPAEDSVATLANTPLAPLSNTITKRGMNLRPSPTDGNPAATMYAFYDSVSDQYVGSKTISGVYTYYFLSATPVWRSRTDWGAPVGTTVVNLLPSTGYPWQAKARNLDGVETVLGPTLFTTTLAPLSLFPVTEGFENTTFPPTDWGRIDVANDGTVPDGATYYGMWGRASTTTYKGGGCARYLWEETGVNGADDWLFNQPMTLQTGISYILSFYVRTSGADEQMAVTIGNAPTVAAQTTILAEYNPLFSTSYIFKGIVFTVPSTGTYYIAFHASTPTNQLWIRMDDIKVAVANPYDAAFLGLTQTTGTRPMKGMNVGEKTDIVTLSEIPFDHSKLNIKNGTKPSDISNTRLVTEPVNTSYKLIGFAGQQEVADAFNNNNGILKGTPSSVNLRAEVANIGVNTIPGFTINYMVDSIAQPQFSGGAIAPGGNIFADIPFAPTARGMFNAIAATDVVGEGDRSNDTARVALMIYPTPAYNLRYDDYYSAPQWGWGVNDPYANAYTQVGTRYHNAQRGRIAQIDIDIKSNRRSGSTYLNTIIPDVWTVRVRAAGPDTNTLGPVLYTKQFSGPKYNTLATSTKTMALGDDAPVIEAGQDFWVTVASESVAVTTGGYPFAMYDGVVNASHLLAGAATSSYASDYVVESWYPLDASVFGAGDYGSNALRAILVPVSNSISGVVYEDKNGNGTKDTGEPPLENWEIKLTNGLNLTTLTDVNGIYAFNALENGTFTLSETIQSTWHCLTPDSTGSLSVTLTGGESQVHNFGNYQGVKPGVQDEDLLATEYRLYQNYPNPFNPNTMIRFSIPNKGQVLLKIHNILGVEVATLVDEVLNPGTYKVSFDGSKFASGLYFYRITSNNYTATMKMLFVK